MVKWGYPKGRAHGVHAKAIRPHRGRGAGRERGRMMTLKERRGTLADKEFRTLYDKAHAVGMEALNKCNPMPMVVTQHEDMLDDRSPIKQQWFVADGACGFAWIVVRPGGSPFANWLKKNELASKHYYGGVSIWVREGNQSIQKKEAYAEAFANMLREAGVDANADSRLD